jgi:hypothetical protein
MSSHGRSEFGELKQRAHGKARRRSGCNRAASARSLEEIHASGTLSVCLPANSLPFSSRHDTPAGFQVELAGLLAQQFGVSLQTDWVISPVQVLRASCDLLLDVIVDPEA